MVAELHLDAEVQKVDDMMQIIGYNVMSLPALVVDEKVVAKGNLSHDRVKELLSK